MNAPLGHNRGPIVAPTEQEALDDLKARFPELETKQAEFEDALKDYPKELSLEDADRAAALQDLLGQIKKQKSIITAHKKDEKGPWDRIVKVVTNLFSTATEKLEKLEEEWLPVHQAYMDKVKAERVRNFHANTIHALAELVAAAGLDHPGQFTPHHFLKRGASGRAVNDANAEDILRPGQLLLDPASAGRYREAWAMAQAGSFAAKLS